jgi:hypothetical protein
VAVVPVRQHLAIIALLEVILFFLALHQLAADSAQAYYEVRLLADPVAVAVVTAPH